MSALKHNLDHYVKALKQNTRLMMMVKGSAYGLGSLEITRWAQATGLISDLAVAYVSEGIELRCSKQISLPIMVIIVTASEFDTCRQFNLEPVIYSIDMLDELLKFLQKLQDQADLVQFPAIHIKLDTGLHRLGISLDEIATLIDKIKSYSQQIHIKSIYTHFVASYNPDWNHKTEYQADLFISSAKKIEKALGYPVIKHLCSSGTALRYPHLNLDMIRLGAGLYGIWPVEPKPIFQKVVASLYAPIIRFEWICKNETVGYAQCQLNRCSLIGVMAIGYVDGLRRHLNNGEAQVWIHGHRVSIISISMDMTMIDLTDVHMLVKINDQVEIFGQNISVEEMSNWCKMVPHEFLSGLGQRIRRVYIAENDEN